MKINKNNFSLVGILILFSILYVFFAVKPPKNSLQLEPQWTISISESAATTSASEVLPFKLGQFVGYYTPEGKIVSILELAERGVISSNYVASFSSSARQTPFFTPQGEQSGVIEKAGFPFFEENRIFLFSPTGNAFSAHNDDGSERWFYEDYAPITTFHSNDMGVVAGFADGKVIVFSEDGIVRQEFYPGGSEYEIIFGAALSNSGRYVACLAGLERQRIIISDIEGNTSKIIFHTYVEDAVLEQSFVHFSKNEQYAFVNIENSLVVVDLDEKESKMISVVGKVVTIKEVQGGDYYFVLSKNRDESTVSIFNSHMYKVGSFSFEEKNTFLDSDNEYVYIGNDMTISKLSVN